MNNYIAIELTEFNKKMSGYMMLLNYRLCNHCVKSEPTAMLPVSVVLGGRDYNFEDVADATRPDEYTFDVYPKNQNNLQAIIKGVFDIHPEFKMELKTDKAENGEQFTHVIYTMPEVNEDRRDLLSETSKAFHKECMVHFDTCYAKEQATLVEMITGMNLSAEEADEARTGFKNVYDQSKEQADKILEAKLVEIEQGYQRYLSLQEERKANDDGFDYSTSMRFDAMDN